MMKFFGSGLPKYKEIKENLETLNQIKDKMVIGKIAYLPSEGWAIFVGDLHGDYETLETIIKQMYFLQSMGNAKDKHLIFLGDYGDRGKQSIETINAIVKLKISFPDNVILLKGNHEEKWIGNSFNTRTDLLEQYGEKKGNIVFDLYYSAMNKIPVMALSAKGIVAVHGGIPNSPINSICDLNGENGQKLAEEIIWNDPDPTISGFSKSSRGELIWGFGEDVFNRFMTVINAKVMIRSHEPVKNGVKLFFENRLANIFSSGGKSASTFYTNQVIRPVIAKICLSKKISTLDAEFFIPIKFL